MTERETIGYWRRIAQDRLRALWIIAHAHDGRLQVGKSFQEDYPGDDVAEVWTHTDPRVGDFVIEARSRAVGETALQSKEGE